MSDRRKKKQGGKKGGGRNAAAPKNGAWLPPRPPRSLPYAKLERATLQTVFTGTMTNNTSTGANQYIQVNNVVTPLLGGSSSQLSHLAALSSMYQNCRVIGCKVIYGFDNQEAFSLDSYLAIVNQSGEGGAPAANDITTAADYRFLSGNPTFTSVMCSPPGGVSKGRIVKNCNIGRTLAQEWTGVVDKFTTTFTSTGSGTAPDTALYMVFGIYSLDGSALTTGNGVTYRVGVEFDTVWFGSRSASS